MKQDWVLISKTGTAGVERAKGAAFGFSMVLVAVALVVTGEFLLSGVLNRWIVGAILIPVVGEVISLVTLMGKVSIENDQIALRRWWKHESVSLAHMQRAAVLGDRVVFSTNDGGSYCLQWPWLVGREERSKRAEALLKALQERTDIA